MAQEAEGSRVSNSCYSLQGNWGYYCSTHMHDMSVLLWCFVCTSLVMHPDCHSTHKVCSEVSGGPHMS